MKVISVNIKMPEEVLINGRLVPTGINKQPVSGTVALRRLGFDGDGQADLAVHGGEFQAVYAYPSEHYAYWQEVMQKYSLPFGLFGENLTTEGLLETDICVGDIFQIGQAQVQVTMHRLPCFKFSNKVGRPEILKEFLWSGRSGFYLKVVAEGNVAAGDLILPISKDPRGISIRRLLGMHRLNEFSAEAAREALSIAVLPPLIRDDFTAKLAAAPA